MATRTFSVLSDFPNQAADLSVLDAEIRADVTLEPIFDGLELEDDTITVNLMQEPDAAQDLALATIIGDHQGVGFVEGIQRQNENAEQTNATSTWQTAATLNSGPLAPGDYEIGVSCELAIQDSDLNSGVQARVLYNGTEQVSMAGQFTVFDVRAVSTPISAAALTQPSIMIQFRRVGAANTARIRRARISIQPLADGNGEE